MNRLVRVLAAIAATWISSAVVAAEGTLFVANGGGNAVVEFPLPAGPGSPFILPGSGGLVDPRGVVFGPDGNLYVTGTGATQGQVLRYDGNTGAFLNLFATTADNAPFGLRFGADGNLYVANLLSASVSRFNGSTGALIGNFVVPGSGGLDAPRDLTFGADGDLFVSSPGSVSGGAVLRFDGVSGAFEGSFATGVDPRGLAFGPGGDLFVASFGTDDIRRFDGITGVFEGIFASGGGLDGPVGLAFGPDSTLYVSSFNTGQILHYSEAGAFVDARGGNLNSPRLLTLAAVTPVPEPETFALLLAGIAAIAVRARRRLVSVDS